MRHGGRRPCRRRQADSRVHPDADGRSAWPLRGPASVAAPAMRGRACLSSFAFSSEGAWTATREEKHHAT